MESTVFQNILNLSERFMNFQEFAGIMRDFSKCPVPSYMPYVNRHLIKQLLHFFFFFFFSFFIRKIWRKNKTGGIFQNFNSN